MSKRSYAQLSADKQRQIVAEYDNGSGNISMQALADRHRLSKSTVRNIISRAKNNDGDPFSERGHKKRKLGPGQVAELYHGLDANPLTTNRHLAHSVGNAIAERTVSTYLARAEPPYTRKVISDQEPEELTEDWKASAQQWLTKVRKIPINTRVYVDETAIYENEALTTGRSRRGKRIFRAHSTYAKKYTLHVYAKRTGVVYWELSELNSNTAEIERVARSAARNLGNNQTVIWDRLGRSGRTQHPVAMHYSPAARESFAAAGARLEFLPSKGKYFNPLELLFNDLKSHYIRPAFPVNGQKFTHQQLVALITQYMEVRAPDTLPGFFKARANGAQALKSGLL